MDSSQLLSDTNASVLALFGAGRWKLALPDRTFNHAPLTPDVGFLLYAERAGTVFYTGERVPNQTHTLEPGWNLIGVPESNLQLTASGLAQAINDAGGSCEVVARYHRGRWSMHSVGLPFNDFDVPRGEAIYVYTSASWSGEFASP